MRMNHYGAIRNRLLAVMIIAPAIPFFLVLLIGYQYYVASVQSEILAKMHRILEDHRRLIDVFLDERKSDLLWVADSNRIEDLTSPETLEKVFKNLQKKSDAFVDVGLFNEEGLHVAYSGPYDLQGRDYSSENWFRQVLERRFYVSDVFLGYRGIPHFVIAAAWEDQGRTWVIRATIGTARFSDVVSRVRIGKTGEAFLINREGLFQTPRWSGGNLMAKVPDFDPPPERFTGVRTTVREDPAGREYLYASCWLHDKDWLLAARQDKNEAFADIRQAALRVTLVTVAGGLLILFMAFRASGYIIGRLEQVDAQRKELGQQLVVAGRLAEIGEMSAGFAHEINNPLQIIKSELALVKILLPEVLEGSRASSEDVTELKDSLEQIGHQVDRCGGITQGLLKFARQKESKAAEVEPDTFLKDVVSLVDQKARVEGIGIEVEVQPEVLTVLADPGHLEQVLVNLLNNAIYAVHDQNGAAGGLVRVEAKNNGDDRVEITVADNGGGISQENLKKIFTPFYTTKPVGQGTGLGLPICYGIVTEMGGEMEVNSVEGVGSTFVVRLPGARRLGNQKPADSTAAAETTPCQK